MREHEAQLLGMHPGTASARLQKRLMLDMLKRLNEDRCMRCGEVIEDPVQLSVDHREPWRGVSADLFWELCNVGFSHLACNKTDRTIGHLQRKIGPPGTAWCSRHQQFLPVGDFGRESRRWNGVARQCKACQGERDRIRRQDPEYKARRRAAAKRYYAKHSEVVQ